MIPLPPFGAVIIPFAAKKNRIRHLTMDFTITGSLWHRVVEVGMGMAIALISEFRIIARGEIRAYFNFVCNQAFVL